MSEDMSLESIIAAYPRASVTGLTANWWAGQWHAQIDNEHTPEWYRENDIVPLSMAETDSPFYWRNGPLGDGDSLVYDPEPFEVAYGSGYNTWATANGKCTLEEWYDSLDPTQL